MVTPLEPVGWALILLAGVGYAVVGVRTHRREDFPGKSSFVPATLLAAGLLFGLVVLISVSRLNPERMWISAFGFVALFSNYVTGLLMPLAWLRFALLFTGQQLPTDRRTFLRIGLPVIVALAGNAVPVSLALLYAATGNTAFLEVPISVIMGVVEYINSLVILYLAALLIVGISLIAWTSYTYRHLSTRAGILLGLGIGLPWVAVAITEVTAIFDGQPVLGNYHIMGGSVLGIAAVGTAVYSYDLFGDVPAAGTVGRETTVEEMSAPVLVVDLNHRLVDLNAAAEALFSVSVESIGTPLETVSNGALDTDDVLDSQAGTTVTVGHRNYEVTLSALHDEHGRVLGHSIVLHDITDRQRREQRIQVLNRVLRHNLRNDMNAINGYAELLVEKVPESDEYAVRVQELATRLLAIGEKAREIEAIVATDADRESVPLSVVVREAVDEVSASFPDCSIQVDSSVDEVAVDRAVLFPVLRELVENAVEHNTAAQPRVRIEATGGDAELTIRVVDNGPGIPDHELAPLREEAETDLEHGSGLGLWLVKWGVSRLNGRIEFDRSEPQGTVATLHLQPSDGGNA
jgi:signal transduction histidine kinase